MDKRVNQNDPAIELSQPLLSRLTAMRRAIIDNPKQALSRTVGGLSPGFPVSARDTR